MWAVAATAQDGTNDGLRLVDHLVYATPDLDLGVRTIEGLFGVRAAAGGQHPGLGTRNALLSLGPSTYLEIIGPDPEQPKLSQPLRFGIDALRSPRLVGWVAKATQLDDVVRRADAAGVRLGAVVAGSRKRPDGVVLAWRYTDPSVVVERRLIPYFIDWGSSPHPAASAPQGARLVALRVEHPDAARMARMLKALGLALPVDSGPTPALIATIESPKGRVTLRGAQ
jgi:hypothetical protein